GVSQACLTCQTTSCDSQTAACLGAGYKSGTFTGPCADFINCTCMCGASDLTCLQACQPKYSSACMSCSTALDACVQQSCGSVCGGSSAPPDMATSASGNCAALATCCGQIPAGQQPGCTAVVGNGNDAQCAAALSGYRAAHECT